VRRWSLPDEMDNHRSAFRCLLAQPEMGPILVVITDVLGHEAFQVAFAQDNHMIEQVSPAIADLAFGNSILARIPEAGSLRCFAEDLYRIQYSLIEL
jgi:hypothetical protein